jgi:hypothetical protein
VIASLPLAANSGKYFATGASMSIWPRSASKRIAGVVDNTFVNDAASNTVSLVVGSTLGSTARFP